MKKFANRVLTATADAAIEALITAAGYPSFCGVYQPREPKNLAKVAAKHRKTK